MKRLAGMFLIFIAAAPAVLAQERLPIAAAALVHVRDGAVQGCGVRLTGGEPNATRASSWFDVSFNVFRQGIAVAQAIAYEMPRSAEEQGDSRPSRVAVQSAWLTSGNRSAKLAENVERRDSLVYTLGLDDALALFEATAQGQPVTLGIKPWGQRTDSVYSAAPVLAGESREQIAGCLASLTE